MSNEEHNSLTGSALHDNKGVSTATDNTVATAVSGATVWAKLTADNLTGTGNPFGAQLLHVRDEQTSGTNGPALTSGAWRTRTINTTKTNEITGASLTSNQITLPAGTYWIQAYAPGLSTNGHTAKLYNITDASDTLIGTVESSNSAGAYAVTRSLVNGRFTIASSKVFELRHRVVTTTGTGGSGAAAGFGVVEVYAEVMIWKIA